MGAANFYRRNASKVYAICMGYEDSVFDDDGNETDEKEYRQPETWEVQDTLENIRERLTEVETFDTETLDGWDNDAPRSYPVMKLASWSKRRVFAGVDLEVEIIATANSGYHEGACLDYMVKTYVAGPEFNTVDLEDLAYYGDKVNKGLSKALAPHANAWLESTVKEVSSEMEKLFDKICGITLCHVATFSNGEAIYEAVKPQS